MTRWSSRVNGRLRRGREVICSARLEWPDSTQRKQPLHGEEFVGDYPLSELQRDAERTISEQLPMDLSRIFGIDAEVRIIETRTGSLTVFFSVLLSGLALFASYADFFDSIELVKQHCSRLLAALQEKYGQRFSIGVNTEFPRLRNPYDYDFHPMMWQGRLPRRFQVLRGRAEPQRDGFFWFLLVFCVALLLVVGALVYGAVVHTYFPGPRYP